MHGLVVCSPLHPAVNEDFSLVKDNPDKQATESVLRELIEEAVLKTHDSDTSFYEQYRNETFKADFQNVMIKMIHLWQKNLLPETKVAALCGT